MSVEETISAQPEKTSNIRTCAVWLAILAVPVLFIFGDKVLPWLTLLCLLTLGFNIVILLPLALIPPTRPWAGLGFFISSYVFGLTGWLMGLELTLILWGSVAVVIGLLFIGIGVVPMGMLATLFNGMWAEFGLLVLAVVLTGGLRILGVMVTEGA